MRGIIVTLLHRLTLNTPTPHSGTELHRRSVLVTVEREDIVKLLHASDIDKPPEISSFSEIFQKRLESIATGSIIYLFKGTYILISRSECGNVLDSGL